MCSVFYIDDNTLIKIDNMVSQTDGSVFRRHWSQDIRPTDLAPVMICGKKKTGAKRESYGIDGNRSIREIYEANENRNKEGIRLTVQRWGFPNPQKKGVLINARSETVREKRIFQNGIRYHRAVIPAKHFYEWNANKEKNQFYSSNVLYLAGFYELFDMEERFIILTTEANESMIRIHDRMPLILEENQVESWLFDDGCVDAILGQKPAQLERKAEYEQLTLF